MPKIWQLKGTPPENFVHTCKQIEPQWRGKPDKPSRERSEDQRCWVDMD